VDGPKSAEYGDFFDVGLSEGAAVSLREGQVVRSLQRRTSAAAKRGAFTLIELVIAMSMVAILAVSLFTTLHIAFRATENAETDIEPSRTADLAMQFIQNDLENALPPNTTGTTMSTVNEGEGAGMTLTSSTGGNGRNVLVGNFEGVQGQDDRGHEADDLVFYSTADGPQHVDANGEVKEIEFAVEQTTDASGNRDHVLVRKVARNLLSEQEINPDEEVICRGVGGLTIQYYDGSQWVNTWDSTLEDNTIPAAVQITLELDRPSAEGAMQTLTFTSVIEPSCSTAAYDPNVNSGGATP
jgi:prepilin-type N-terminal cleavage/methylation domain-containing protein